jgi:hypothetical protein
MIVNWSPSFATLYTWILRSYRHGGRELPVPLGEIIGLGVKALSQAVVIASISLGWA